MKKITEIIVFTLMLSILSGMTNAFAEPEVLENEKVEAISEVDIITEAISTLLDYWKNEVYKNSLSETKYLGIKNTRIIWIKDELGPFDSEESDEREAIWVREQTEAMFSDVKCIVSFVLFSDLQQFGELYYVETGAFNNVIVHKDNTFEVVMKDPLHDLLARTFCLNFASVISSVSEHDAEFNGDYYLADSNEADDETGLTVSESIIGGADEPTNILITENETDGVIEKFLTWLFTSNCNDRNNLYTKTMEQIAEETLRNIPEPENIPGIVEYEGDLDSLLWNEYYGPVMNIVSPEMLDHMKKNRLPFSYDSFQEAVGVTTAVEAVTFDNETTSPFTAGTIYDFDVTVKVEGDGEQDVVEAYYHKGDDGKYHIQGQITVDEGKITKLYINKALRK